MLEILNVIGGRDIVCSTLLTPEIRIYSKSIVTLSSEPNKLCLHKRAPL